MTSFICISFWFFASIGAGPEETRRPGKEKSPSFFCLLLGRLPLLWSRSPRNRWRRTVAGIYCTGQSPGLRDLLNIQVSRRGACLIDISIPLYQYRVNTFSVFFYKKNRFFCGFWWFFYLVFVYCGMVLFRMNSDIEILSFSAACFIWLYSVSDALKLRPVLLSSGFTAGRPEPGRDPPFGFMSFLLASFCFGFLILVYLFIVDYAIRSAFLWFGIWRLAAVILCIWCFLAGAALLAGPGFGRCYIVYYIYYDSILIYIIKNREN
jgi:hypothetical protein